MNVHKMADLTPTEFTRNIFIKRAVSSLKGRVSGACDIGCGIGTLLNVLEDTGIPLMGVDTSDESLAIAAEKVRAPHVKIKKGGINDLGEKFDLIFLTDVLEHVEDDGSFLREIRDTALNEGGWFLMTVPAHSRLYSRFDKNVGHFRRYDKKHLRKLLQDNGFEPVVFWSYGIILFHFLANMIERPEKSEKEESFEKRTSTSSIRKFSGLTKTLVSRVNALHYLCYFMDRVLLKHLDMGLQYFVLCRKKGAESK